MWIILIVPVWNLCVGFHVMAKINELLGPDINVLDGDIWYLHPRTLHKTSFMLSNRNIAAVWIIDFIGGTFNVVGICTNVNYTQTQWAVCMIIRLSVHIQMPLHIDHVFAVLCHSVTW